MRSKLEDQFAAMLKLSGLPEPVREFRFMPPRRYRFDFAWPEQRIAAEVDGGIWIRGRHNTGSGIESDDRKINFAALRGWRVFRFTSGMLKSWEAIHVITEALREGQSK